MNENGTNDIFKEENQILKEQLQQALLEKEKLEQQMSGTKKSDIKTVIKDSKDKFQEKMNDEKVQEKIQQGKEVTSKTKDKVLESSRFAWDALKTAKNVFLNKELKERFKDEFNERRKHRNDPK